MGQSNSNFELASEARRAAERCEGLGRIVRVWWALPIACSVRQRCVRVCRLLLVPLFPSLYWKTINTSSQRHFF